SSSESFTFAVDLGTIAEITASYQAPFSAEQTSTLAPTRKYLDSRCRQCCTISGAANGILGPAWSAGKIFGFSLSKTLENKSSQRLEI
uniref:Uncharacterized protein n=1 Tax=Romanomermis culicivorax TaxID=13658 RepID=A0A915J4K0_ROMCU